MLGVIGIFLPLLPTTPFILLACYCFSKSSERYHQWLLNHPLFGQAIQDYQAGLGISLKHKISAWLMIWLSIGSCIIFIVDPVALKLLLLIIAGTVSIYLARLPTSSRGTHTP